MSKKPIFVPQHFHHVIAEKSKSLEEYTGDETAIYDLNWIQRIFVLFEHPNSCRLAGAISVITGCIIFINVLFFVFSTCPIYQKQPSTCLHPVCHNDSSLCPGYTVCKPVAIPIFQNVQAVCIIAFTFHYIMRVITCWSVSPRLANLTINSKEGGAALMVVLRYVSKWDNIVDICSILPFYIFLGLFDTITVDQSSGFIRVLWLPRLLKSLTISDSTKAMCEIFYKTLGRSAQTLLFAFFFITIGTVVFASIIFNLESGTFIVTDAYPTGAYLRENDILGVDGVLSLFTSIPVSMYFTVVTTTSLGYGDIVPRSTGGVVLACVLCIIGVGVIALPIAVIGGNFANFYEAYMMENLSKKKTSETADTRRHELIDLQPLDIALQHEAKCKKFTFSSRTISGKVSTQSEKLLKAQALLTVIVERSRRITLTKNMAIVGDERTHPFKHRSRQPATVEQMMKWNQHPSGAGSGSNGHGSSASSLDGAVTAKVVPNPVPPFGKILCAKIWRFIGLGGPVIVPQIYMYSAPKDLYFPEVRPCIATHLTALHQPYSSLILRMITTASLLYTTY